MPDIHIQPGIRIPDKTFRFRTSRSSGPGGQNVNKLDTRVELVITLESIEGLSDDQRSLLEQRLSGRLDSRGRLHFVSQRFRSQGQNRDDVVRMVIEEINSALVPAKKRKPTKPTSSSNEKRLETKRKRSGTKKQRRAPDDED